VDGYPDLRNRHGAAAIGQQTDPMTATILNFAKLKIQILDKNERAGQWIVDHAEQVRLLKYGCKPKSQDDRRG
tara:strand:- start:27665 stop:27883 length:219 start_codon:yes stop_codon:yes gene_type:complete